MSLTMRASSAAAQGDLTLNDNSRPLSNNDGAKPPTGLTMEFNWSWLLPANRSTGKSTDLSSMATEAMPSSGFSEFLYWRFIVVPAGSARRISCHELVLSAETQSRFVVLHGHTAHFFATTA